MITDKVVVADNDESDSDSDAAPEEVNLKDQKEIASNEALKIKSALSQLESSKKEKRRQIQKRNKEQKVFKMLYKFLMTLTN